MCAAKKSNKKNHTFWTMAPTNFSHPSLASFHPPFWTDLSTLLSSPQPCELASFRREHWFDDLADGTWETNASDWPTWCE